MFPTTITLTIATVAKVLNRVNQDGYGSEYQLNGATESINLKIRHSTDAVDSDGLKMKRHNVFVEHIVYPTPTTAMMKSTFTGTLRHGSLSDPAQSADLSKAVCAWLTTASNLADLSAGIN